MELSRRDLVKAAVAGPAAVGAVGLISACEGSASPASAPAAGVGKPKGGGISRPAITGGSSADTLDPLSAITNADFSRAKKFFEPLVALTPSQSAGRLVDIVPNSISKCPQRPEAQCQSQRTEGS